MLDAAVRPLPHPFVELCLPELKEGSPYTNAAGHMHVRGNKIGVRRSFLCCIKGFQVRHEFVGVQT